MPDPAADARRPPLAVAIPHFFDPNGSGRYGSTRADPKPRVAALRAAILGLWRSFGGRWGVLDIQHRRATPGPRRFDLSVQVVTVAERHLVGSLDLPTWMYTHQVVEPPSPMLLGFECHGVLRSKLEAGGWYGFIEDDLVVQDPSLLDKLAWFGAAFGDGALLQPNRYETAVGGRLERLYVDGPLRPGVAQPWMRPDGPGALAGSYGGRTLRFERATNPHSGCFFLTAAQMRRWAKAPWFGDRDPGFIGPLESAATLGLLKTFDVYKTAPADCDFVEIEHAARSFIHMVGGQVAWDPADFPPDPSGSVDA